MEYWNPRPGSRRALLGRSQPCVYYTTGAWYPEEDSNLHLQFRKLVCRIRLHHRDSLC